MITHLISTTKFVNTLKETRSTDQVDCAETFDSISNELLGKIFRYVSFISQKPILSMFVACDEEGNVLEEPNHDKVPNMPPDLQYECYE